MDQWKREAIKVLREMEFGKTILDYGDSDDSWDQPWEDHVCPICECEGYHAVDCELQKLLTPPREQLMLLKKVYELFENGIWGSIVISGEFVGDMMTYGLVEGQEIYGDWFYRIICSQEYIDGLLKNTREEQGTSGERSEQSVEQSEKEEQ